jgi:Ca2+/Na+ antiporter
MRTLYLCAAYVFTPAVAFYFLHSQTKLGILLGLILLVSFAVVTYTTYRNNRKISTQRRPHA